MTSQKKTLLESARSVRDRIVLAPERVRAATKLAATTGLLWEMGRSGLRELIRVGFTGTQNPSVIYRIHGANTPNKPAVIFRDRTVTYGELNTRLDKLSAGLVARGIVRGKSVLLMMKNGIEFIEIGAALSRIGAHAVSISWRSTPAELTFLAQNSGAIGIAFDRELESTIKTALPNLSPALAKNLYVVGDSKGMSFDARPFESLADSNAGAYEAESGADDEAAVVIYTSGTTGKPKGAVRKFPPEALPALFRFISETPMRCDDVHLVTCPLYHSTAFGFMGFSVIVGATVVIMDEFKPEKFVEMVDRYRVTTTALVPTMLHRVLQLPEEIVSKHEMRSLRSVMCGGAQLSGQLAIDFMDRFGDVLFNFYGATETGLVTLAKPSDLRAAPGTIGRALPTNDIRLLDDAGNDAGDGPGELFVKNATLVTGYHDDDNATKSSMKSGYFSVGDIARRDRFGRYFIEGRKRDMIITGGVNVYPAEIEATLEQHEGVSEVAVVGVEDPEWGERVRAFIVPRAGLTIDEGELKIWVRERLMGPKVPRDFVMIDALPRNPTGKVLKRELREKTA